MNVLDRLTVGHYMLRRWSIEDDGSRISAHVSVTNAVILRIRGRGSGLSNGNWTDALAVVNSESSFAKAFSADGVG